VKKNLHADSFELDGHKADPQTPRPTSPEELQVCKVHDRSPVPIRANQKERKLSGFKSAAVKLLCILGAAISYDLRDLKGGNSLATSVANNFPLQELVSPMVASKEHHGLHSVDADCGCSEWIALSGG
jgi:hypothetical protein